MSKYHPSVGERHRARVPRADDAANVDALDRRIEVRQRQMLRRRRGGELAALLRRQVLRECPSPPAASIRRRADRTRAPTRPARRTVRCRPCRRSAARRAPWNMPRSRGCGEPDGRATRVPPGSSTASVGRDLADRRAETGRGDPCAVRRRQPLEQRRRAHRADDLDRRAPRRQVAVLPREDQRRQVAVVVDVKVRERDVRDRRPLDRRARRAGA